MLQHKINTKKLKTGLVVSYNIRPGNGEGLFWFQHFHKSVTYLLTPTHLLTDPGLTWGKRHCTDKQRCSTEG